ncbi:MAG: ATP-binding protein [SAR324 cluster bacterium]|nr:ATP-binding protein [SAR324 cluster bacterium]
MSISQNIIEQHKVQIRFNSELGRGTTFKIYLPVAS